MKSCLKLLPNSAALSVLLATISVSSGCGPKPIAMPSFKKGGNVRVLNLASLPTSTWIAGQEAGMNLEQGNSGGFRLTSLKKKDIKVMVGEQTVFKGDLLCQSDQVYSIVAFNDGRKVQAKIVSGEPKIGDGSSARVAIVNLIPSSTSVSVKLVVGSRNVSFDSVAFGATSIAEVVPAGKMEWTGEADGSKFAGNGEVWKGEGNTIFVYANDSKPSSLLMSNKPKIRVAGPSGSSPMN